MIRGMRCRLTRVLCSAIFLMLVGAMIGCSREGQQAKEYLSQANALYAQGSFVEARQQLELYLALDRQNPQVFLLLGQIAEKQGNAALALQHYGQVVALDKENVDAHVAAARLLLAANDVVQAERLLQTVKTFRPDDARILTLEVGLLQRKGDLPGAIAQGQKLLATDPDSVDAAAQLADLHARAGDFSSAEKILRDALARHERHSGLRFQLARVLVAGGQPKDGEMLLRELLQGEPGVFPYMTQLADLYAGENRLDEAEDLLRRGVRDDPSDDRRMLVLTDFLSQKRGQFVAEEELVNGIFARPESLTLRLALADLYERMLNLDGAAKVYQEVARIAKTGPVVVLAETRAANVFLHLGEVAEAEAATKLILNADPQNVEGILLRGRIAFANGNAAAAIDDFRTVLGKRPESFEVLSQLIRAYVMAGESAMAEQGLRRAIEVDPKHEGVRLELIQLLTEARRYDDALTEIDHMLAVLPNNLDALQTRVDVLIARQEWEKAEAQAQQIQSLYPDKVTGYLQLGHIYFTQSRYDKAEEMYKNAVAQSPLDYPALQSLVQSMMMKDGLSAAQNYVEGFLKGYSNHPTAYNILGELYMQQNEHTKAEAAFVRAYQLNPTWINPYKNLGKLYELRGELEAAVQVFLNGLSIVPDSVQLAFLLATAYEELGKYADAADTYEGILANRPRMDLAANNLALMLVEKVGDEAGNKRAVELVQRFHDSKSALFVDTMGWVYYKAGKVADAVKVLEPVVAAFPSIPMPHYHLGAAYLANGQRDEARAQLRQALEPRVPFAGVDDAKKLLQQLESKGS